MPNKSTPFFTFGLLIGAVLIALFFPTLFESSVFDLSGVDLFDFVRQNNDSKIRAVDELTGFLMLAVPIGALVLGGLEILRTTGRLTTKGAPIPGISFMLYILILGAGIVLAYRMETKDASFLNSLFPRPTIAFYGMLTALLIGAVGNFMDMMRK